MKFPLEKKKGI